MENTKRDDEMYLGIVDKIINRDGGYDECIDSFNDCYIGRELWKVELFIDNRAFFEALGNDSNVSSDDIEDMKKLARECETYKPSRSITIFGLPSNIVIIIDVESERIERERKKEWIDFVYAEEKERSKLSNKLKGDDLL